MLSLIVRLCNNFVLAEMTILDMQEVHAFCNFIAGIDWSLGRTEKIPGGPLCVWAAGRVRKRKRPSC